MEPFTYFYDTINRHALVVKAKQPFYDWVNGLEPDFTLPELEESNVYLVKEKTDNLQVERWLSRNFDKIFQNELNDWHTHEEKWPAKRTYKLFKEWFKVEIHSMVMDMEESEIQKDTFY